MQTVEVRSRRPIGTLKFLTATAAMLDACEQSRFSSPGRGLHLAWALTVVDWAGVEGDVVELGCNEGSTSVLLQDILNRNGSRRRLHVFDSFEGLPEPDRAFDPVLERGKFRAVQEDVLTKFSERGFDPPMLHRGWVDETVPAQLPELIAVAYVDLDLYHPTLHSLLAVYSRLDVGGLMLVDDCGNGERGDRVGRGIPGVRLACDEFGRAIGAPFQQLVAPGEDLTLAMFRKCA